MSIIYFLFIEEISISVILQGKKALMSVDSHGTSQQLQNCGCFLNL